VSTTPTPPREPLSAAEIARQAGEFLDSAAETISLRERVLRLRTMAPRIALVSVAATTSYLIARYGLGHPRPFFAPIATVAVLGITLGQRTQRALQMALGGAVGVLVADLSVQALGTGAWQMALIVFAAMCVVVFAGGDQMATVQAANAGILIAALAIPNDPTGFARFLDVLVGSSTALFFNLVLFPVNPLRLASGALDPAIERLAAVLDAIADALERGDDEATRDARMRAAALEEHLADMRAAVATSGEVARLALLRRGQRDAVERYTRAVDHIARAQRDVAALARGADRALRLHDEVPPAVIEGIRALADAARHLVGAVADPDERAEARAAALEAAVATTAGLDETRNLSVSIVVGQARMTAHDFLRATGLSIDEARAELRAAGSPATASAPVIAGPSAEVDAARPGDSGAAS
jgi:uncharacterized membrane protein YgaE (UPF0421/DUF939 family)